MNDDKFYDEVAREIMEKRLLPGLWARALEESDGNNDKAKAVYIRYRVSQLEQENKQRSEQRELREEEIQKQLQIQAEQERFRKLEETRQRENEAAKELQRKFEQAGRDPKERESVERGLRGVILIFCIGIGFLLLLALIAYLCI